MSFLLDTDICSAYLKNHRQIVGQAMLHFGSLHVSVVTVCELLTWALRAKAPASRIQGVRDFLAGVAIHDVDVAVAETFGALRAALFDRLKTMGEMDLLNASVALVQILTLVSHNIPDYAAVRGLVSVDWLSP